jgi:16S rRNA (guanine527-N7)-methyltransferase
MNSDSGKGDFAGNVTALLGISLSGEQLHAFRTYEDLLLEWNRRINLTAITGREDVRVKHFLDSLSCRKVLTPQPGIRIIDIGTGAGFPGVPLKILYPDIRLTLVDSVGKKTDFCRRLVDRLGLENVTVIHARAEEVGRDPEHRGAYQWALARAVADLSVLAEYLLPLVTVGGRILAQKGAGGPAEVRSASKALNILGGAVEHVEPVDVPGIAETRHLIVIRKSAATPEQYPRRTGVPSKRPLSGKGHGRSKG